MEACSYQAVELILGLSATAENTIARWGSRPEAWSRYSAIPRSSVLDRRSTAFVATACGRSHSTVLRGLLVTPATHWEERPRLDNLTARRDDLEGVFPQFWWICHAWLCFGLFGHHAFVWTQESATMLGLSQTRNRIVITKQVCRPALTSCVPALTHPANSERLSPSSGFLHYPSRKRSAKSAAFRQDLKSGLCKTSGHSRAGTKKDAAVAQLVEHVIRNDGVGGSSPFSGTILLKSSSHRWSPVARQKGVGQVLIGDRP